MISKPVLEIVPSRRPYPGGRRFGQAGTAWQTVIMSGRPCRRDAAGPPAFFIQDKVGGQACHLALSDGICCRDRDLQSQVLESV